MYWPLALTGWGGYFLNVHFTLEREQEVTSVATSVVTESLLSLESAVLRGSSQCIPPRNKIVSSWPTFSVKSMNNNTVHSSDCWLHNDQCVWTLPQRVSPLHVASTTEGVYYRVSPMHVASTTESINTACGIYHRRCLLLSPRDVASTLEGVYYRVSPLHVASTTQGVYYRVSTLHVASTTKGVYYWVSPHPTPPPPIKHIEEAVRKSWGGELCG